MYDTSKKNTPTTGKKPYIQPKLTVYGELHLLTQGSGNVNGDGGQNMMV